MKAVILVLACVAAAAALSVKSSPEARFMSTEAGVESTMSAATVVSDRDYAALKHEEAEKAVRALHLPGDKPDLLADLGIHADADAAADEAEAANDEELLALAAETESTDAEDAESAETVEGLEAEIEAAEAEEDAADVLIETAAVEEDEEEAEEESEDEEEAEDESEDEAEAEDESEDESEDAVFLEVADEDEAEEEEESEAEDEDEAEAEEESEDLALIEEEAEKPKAYISPVLRPALPSKHNDEMPDAAYDKVAETNLFPPAKHLVGAGPKPPAFTPQEIAAADAKIAKAKAAKVKAAAPKPAVAAAKKSKRSKRSKRVNRRKGRKNRKNRRAARKGGRRSRRNRRGARKGRKNRRGGKRSRKSKKALKRKGKKARAGAAKKSKCKKPGDPRCIITAPYLQDIRDARHKHFIKTTNDLLNEVDDGILEHMVYPPIADPNKKKCKTKKAKKF